MIPAALLATILPLASANAAPQAAPQTAGQTPPQTPATAQTPPAAPAAPATPTPRGGAGAPAARSARPASADMAYRWFDPLIDLRALLVDGFVEAPDEQAMQRAALEAMTRALGDPFTIYVPPAAESRLRQQITGSYVGIGVELDIDDGRPTVITPLDDSPALEAGILPGDTIMEVDGVSTEGADLARLDELLPGAPGTRVRLKLRRPDGAERTLEVPRRQVETRSVKGIERGADGWRYTLDTDRHIAYLRIAQFTERTLGELDAALAHLRGEGVSGIVLDLRGNGGGSLDAAVGVADRFLSRGGIVSIRGRGDRGRTWDAGESTDDIKVPMVVLVNQGSASASEVVAGALKDNGRAKVIGTRSYGKGSVQEIRPLPDGAGTLKMTTARYFLPSGRSVSRLPGAARWGVEPDTGFHVPMTEEAQLSNAAARRAWESVAGGSAGAGAPGAAPGAGAAPDRTTHWEQVPWIRDQAHDPQLAAALEAMVGFLDAGEWPVVGDLSGDVGAANDELRASLELRRRLLEELRRTDREISKLRGAGGGVDDPLLAGDAPYIDAELLLRDREGRVIGRWIVKDPKALRRGIAEGANPAPEYTPASEPEGK
ncbi:MAG: S41 family peptidase [Phycisphaerales bacterium]